MSTKVAARKESSRGPAWDRKALEIAYRDGAYRDAEGRLHKVCRNWLEAKRQGLEAELPRGCARTNGEDEVWACHSNSWSKYPALRLVDDNIMALCRHCDPDRNPAMRANWWGSPQHPVRAGWERRQARQLKRQKLPAMGTLFAAGILWGMHLPGWGGLWPWGALAASLALWPELGLSTALWVLLLALGFHSHRLHAPLTFGGYLGWLAALLGAWLACLEACTVGLGWLRRKGGR